MTSKKTGLLSSAFWNILSLVVVAVAGFITVPIIIREIGADNFGLYSIILMVGGFVALQDLGLGEATLRFVAKYYAKGDLDGINRVLGATLFIYCVVGLVVFGVIELVSPHIVSVFKIAPNRVDEAVLALRIAGFGFLFTTFRGALQRIPEATLRYDVSSKVLIAITIVRRIVVVVVVMTGGGLVGLSCVLAADALVNILVYYFIAHRLIPGVRCFPNIRKDGLREVFSYGIFSFLNQLIGNVAQYMDRFILGVFFGVADVGYLTAPKDLLIKAQGVTGAAGRALFPRFSGMDEGPEMERLYGFSLWALTSFSVLLFIPAAIVMPKFLSLWISPEFAEHSGAVSRLLAIGLALNGGVSSYFALLKGTGRVHWVTVIYSTLTVFSIFVTAWLVYRFGLIGSGIRMILFSWCGIAICLGVGRKVFPDFKFSRVLFESAVIPVALGLIVFFVGCQLSDYFQLCSWLGVISLAAGTAGVLSVSTIGINYLIFGEEGGAGVLLKKVASMRLFDRVFSRLRGQ